MNRPSKSYHLSVFASAIGALGLGFRYLLMQR